MRFTTGMPLGQCQPESPQPRAVLAEDRVLVLVGRVRTFLRGGLASGQRQPHRGTLTATDQVCLGGALIQEVAVEVRLETTASTRCGKEPTDERIVHERLGEDVQNRLPVCDIRLPHECVRCISRHAYNVSPLRQNRALAA